MYYLKALWPYFLFHFFAVPLQAYLIGLGYVKDAFIIRFGLILSLFSLMFFLGSQTNIGMQGIIIGMNCGVVVLTVLHYVTICKVINVSFFHLSIKRIYLKKPPTVKLEVFGYQLFIIELNSVAGSCPPPPDKYFVVCVELALSKPAWIETTASSVYPTNQASLTSLVVPVLPAASREERALTPVP